jgi:hypothetical protein
MKSEEAGVFQFYIYLNGPGRDYDEKRDILSRYGLTDYKNIHCLNRPYRRERYLFAIDTFLNRVLGRVKLLSYRLYEIGRKTVDLFREGVAVFPFVESPVVFDVIFRDYNLKESIGLSCLIRQSPEAKIVIYPHAIGLQRVHQMCPREPIKQVRADLWLENSDFSDQAKKDPNYQKVFYPSGVPALDINYKLPPLFNAKSKRIIMITRDCSLTFGFTYEMAMDAFRKVLEQLIQNGYEVHIKHHPRDRKVNEWRAIQQSYPNCYEIEESLSVIDEEWCACFTLFSTAPLFLLSRGVPVFEFSPYLQYDAYERTFPMHYKDRNGNMTHDLLDMGIFHRIESGEDLSLYLTEESLAEISSQEIAACRKVFPEGANAKITKKLKEMTDE